jgi:hypothetical protein
VVTRQRLIKHSRWVRLLFGREFPFDQLLVLWDTIFAFDPTLELIDLVCAAMLLRIRWTCKSSLWHDIVSPP